MSLCLGLSSWLLCPVASTYLEEEVVEEGRRKERMRMEMEGMIMLRMRSRMSRMNRVRYKRTMRMIMTKIVI